MKISVDKFARAEDGHIRHGAVCPLGRKESLMGRKSIVGRLPVVYDPARRGFAVENSAEFVKTQIRQKLDELAHGKPLRLTVTFELERKGRSINQNRMMWALLTIMADATMQAGGRHPAGGLLYRDAGGIRPRIRLSGASGGCCAILRNAYRLVHIVELLDNDRCTVKASMGSSSFSTAQMTAFIDGIFDRLAEMGVNDPNVTAYWQEWQEVPK